MSHITPVDVMEAKVYLRTIAQFGLHTEQHLDIAEQKLLLLVEQAIERAYRQFQDDCAVATEFYLKDQGDRMRSELFACWRDQLDSDN